MVSDTIFIKTQLQLLPGPRLAVDSSRSIFGVLEDLLGIPLNMPHDVWVNKMVEYPVPHRTRPCVKCVGLILKGDLEFMMCELKIVYRE